MLSPRVFMPSLILALDDQIIPSTFLLLCMDSYDTNNLGEKSHFMSPSLCPDHTLKHFPPTRFMMAGNCPLRDESYKFALRMV